MKASIVVFAVLLVAFACGREQPALSAPPLALNEGVSTNATVRFVPLEGGCWALETSAGKYEPIDLPEEFRKDGLEVYVVARGAPHAVSICQIAPLVTLDSIRTR